MKNINIADYALDIELLNTLRKSDKEYVKDLYTQLLYSVDEGVNSIQLRFNTLYYGGYLKRVDQIERSNKLKKILNKDGE